MRLGWSLEVQPNCLKGRVVCGTVYGEMYLKDLLGSLVRVGFRIPVPDFYLVLHGLRCRKSTIMDWMWTKLNWESVIYDLCQNLENLKKYFLTLVHCSTYSLHAVFHVGFGAKHGWETTQRASAVDRGAAATRPRVERHGVRASEAAVGLGRRPTTGARAPTTNRTPRTWVVSKFYPPIALTALIMTFCILQQTCGN